MMQRLTQAAARKPKLTVGFWALLFLTALPFAAQQSTGLTGGGFKVSGAQSSQADAVVAREFPSTEKGRLGVMVVSATGEKNALRRGLLEVKEAVDETSKVDLPPMSSLIDVDRRAVLIPLRVQADEDHATDVAADLSKKLDQHKGKAPAASIYVLGQGALIAGVQERAKKDLSKAEQAGFPIILVVLLVIFGSIAAALVPFVLGIVAILITGALIFALTQVMEMSIYVTTLASMIGIGVSVDYSLFLVARYRQELSNRQDPAEAREIAMATSGRSVGFSGLTVVVALAGLFVVNNTALRSMAMGAIVVVAVSVLASLTIVPAVLALAGDRLGRRNRWLSRRRTKTKEPGRSPQSLWARWSAFVMDRAVVMVIASSAFLLALAFPVTDLNAHTGALAQLSKSDQVREGFELAAKHEGQGALSPTKVLIQTSDVDGPKGTVPLKEVRTTIMRDPEVARVGAPQSSDDNHAYLIEVVPKSDPESEQAKQMVERLRHHFAGSESISRQKATVLIGGVTAEQLDSENQIFDSLWKVLLAILLLSFAVLTLLLKSIVLPIKSVVMNLLSVGAAYGILVIVFQWGWFDGLFGFESPGYIDTLTLPLVLAVVFGLSMDYEVFLLSRIRERYLESGDTRDAVVFGLTASAATITSAAFIMVTVFSVFVATSVPSIKEIGLGSAVAVALDATVVRLTLVPAAMVLVGRWNWWLPRFLGGGQSELRPEQVDVAS